MYFVGVDGCMGQCWLAVILGGDGRAEAWVFSDVFALWRECEAVSLILIDIPIRESGMRRQSNLDLYILYRVECKARRKIRSN